MDLHESVLRRTRERHTAMFKYLTRLELRLLLEEAQNDCIALLEFRNGIQPTMPSRNPLVVRLVEVR